MPLHRDLNCLDLLLRHHLRRAGDKEVFGVLMARYTVPLRLGVRCSSRRGPPGSSSPPV